MNDDFNCSEKYNKLYSQYRQLLEKMINKKNTIECSNRTAIELSIYAKELYSDKSNIIRRMNSLFSQEQNLSNLKELINLYELLRE